MNRFPALPKWDYSYHKKLVSDALLEMRQRGYSFVCTKEQLKEILKVYPDVKVSKLHSYCYHLEVSK